MNENINKFLNRPDVEISSDTRKVLLNLRNALGGKKTLVLEFDDGLFNVTFNGKIIGQIHWSKGSGWELATTDIPTWWMADEYANVEISMEKLAALIGDSGVVAVDKVILVDGGDMRHEPPLPGSIWQQLLKNIVVTPEGEASYISAQQTQDDLSGTCCASIPTVLPDLLPAVNTVLLREVESIDVYAQLRPIFDRFHDSHHSVKVVIEIESSHRKPLKLIVSDELRNFPNVNIIHTREYSDRVEDCYWNGNLFPIVIEYQIGCALEYVNRHGQILSVNIFTPAGDKTVLVDNVD